ncbi:MAG: hypothetical protein WBM55_05100 [Muriicola sp.]
MARPEENRFNKVILEEGLDEPKVLKTLAKIPVLPRGTVLTLNYRF